MAAYSRQSSFADGSTINASLFNNEYDALAAAFVNTSGHKHDGTTGEGPVIGVIGDAGIATPLNKVLIDTANDHIEFYVDVSSSAVQQLYIADGVVAPVTDSDIDLGTSSLYYKNAYIDAITTTGNVAVGGNLTVTGTTTFNGGTLTLGDADTDNIVFGGEVDSNIIPDDDGTYDLGSSSKEWKDLFIDGTANIDSLVADTADINGGTIDGAVIGGSSAAAITGTTITGTAITGTSFVIGSANISEAELEILDGATVTTDELNILDGVTASAAELNLLDGKAFLDEDDMSSNSATGIASQQSIKAYVDTQITAEDLDITTDSGTIAIDLDSETLTVSGGTGLDSSATGNAVTLAIDSTVTTLTGTQTLTNKTLTTPVISSISNTGTLTLPTSTDTLVGRATTDTLTNKTLTSATLTSPVINTGVSGTAFLDDDTFATATASTLASSESIKAYVDTTVAATNEVVEDTTPQLGGDLDLNSNDITGTGNIDVTGTVTADDLTVATGGISQLSKVTRIGDNSTYADLTLNSADSSFGSINFADASDSNIGRIQYNHTDNTMILRASDATRVTVSSTGIDVTGTVTSDGLTVAGTSQLTNTSSIDTLILAGNTGSVAGVKLQAEEVHGAMYGVNIGSNFGGLAFHTNNNGTVAEKVRIDNAGNLLVGTTTTSAGNEGLVYFNGSSLRVTRDGDEPLNLDRRSSDGDIAVFQKDGTAIGSIGVGNSNDLTIGTGDTGLVFQDNERISPWNLSTNSLRDNAIDFGDSDRRFKDIYLAGNIHVAGNVDGRNVAADGTKLDGIESSATADQTKADIEGLGIDVPATNLTGTIPAARLSTATTQAESDDSNKIATTAYVVDKITTLIGGAPSTLNDLNELAAAINDDANYNSTLTTALATKLPLAGGAMTGAITTNSTFDGRDVSADGTKLDTVETNADVTDATNVTSAGALMTTGGTMTGAINLGDNVKANFGTGNDLEIFHNGSNSFIKDNGNGALVLDSNGTDVRITKTDSEFMAKFVIDGAVELYNDNVKKFETTSTGIDVTGTVQATALSATSTYTNIIYGGSSNLQLKSNTGETFAQFNNNGNAELYFDTSKKLETTSTGIDVTGVITTDGLTTSADINFGDSDKAVFGTGNDLQIYHDGSNSFISDEGTGVLALTTNGNAIQFNAAGEQMAAFNKDGAVELFHNNVKKFETTSVGVNVTGTLEFDSISDGTITATAFVDEDDMSSDSATLIPTQQSVKAYVDNSSATGLSLIDEDNMASNSATRPPSQQSVKAYTDSSIANLVDSSPSALNTLNELAAALGDDANFSTTVTNSIAANLPKAGGTMTGDLILGDNVRIEIGDATGGDLQIYHDGSSSFISDQGTGNLRLLAQNFVVADPTNSEAMIVAFPNGAVDLYYDNSIKFSTSATGATLTGNLAVTGTVDGRDVATDGSTLDATTTTANAALPKAGGTMTGNIAHAGNFSLDVASDLTLDAGGGDIILSDDGTIVGTLSLTGNDLKVRSRVSDKDLIFQGNDGGSEITALTLDMSDGGTAIFNHDVQLGDNSKATFGNGSDLQIYHNGSDSYIDDNGTGDFDIRSNGTKISLKRISDGHEGLRYTLGGSVLLKYDNNNRLETSNAGVDVTGGITVTGTTTSSGNVVGDGIVQKAGGSEIGRLTSSGNNFYIQSAVSDGDILIRGNDGGSTITAVSFDMSEAGAATFNNNVTAYSDERLKTNIETIDNALDKVSKMRGVTFERDGVVNSGVIAQEFEKIAPELVKTADDEIGTKSVAYGNTVGYLIEAIKELKAEVADLKSKKNCECE